MRPGRLRSRHYATVWTPAESKRGWLPAPYDALSRERRGEAIVVDGERPAHWCESCQAVLVDPLPEPVRELYGPARDD
jgi:hypothetical protein